VASGNRWRSFWMAFQNRSSPLRTIVLVCMANNPPGASLSSASETIFFRISMPATPLKD
jgi:hypothetical protein